MPTLNLFSENNKGTPAPRRRTRVHRCCGLYNLSTLVTSKRLPRHRPLFALLMPVIGAGGYSVHGLKLPNFVLRPRRFLPCFRLARKSAIAPRRSSSSLAV